ncbi:Uncharacterised protein [Mycobacteroides abscessus]|nr:Uncharacterised protein [Mycobacteroides abscessus]
MSRRRQIIARPATTSGTRPSPGTAETAVETTWFGTRSASCSNHHRLSCVSTTPLSGIPGDSTWS